MDKIDCELVDVPKDDEEDEIPTLDGVSNCCGASVGMDERCMGCGEHCAAVPEEEEIETVDDKKDN